MDVIVVGWLWLMHFGPEPGITGGASIQTHSKLGVFVKNVAWLCTGDLPSPPCPWKRYVPGRYPALPVSPYSVTAGLCFPASAHQRPGWELSDAGLWRGSFFGGQEKQIAPAVRQQSCCVQLLRLLHQESRRGGGKRNTLITATAQSHNSPSLSLSIIALSWSCCVCGVSLA